MDIVVKEKGLQKGDTFELAFDGDPLPNDRPIGSFDFEDADGPGPDRLAGSAV